ncbi:imelysin family protein [Vibrio sp. MA40-2]|uniref:imelysin family protein n=1 Tax=Vibrio sp. MA40-2 TaxID=3391828 RepID=UPI0039A5A4BE
MRFILPVVLSTFIGGVHAGTSDTDVLSTTNNSRSVYLEFKDSSAVFAQSTKQLSGSIDHYCETPNNQSIQEVRNSWHSAMLNWNRLQGFDRGPIEALEKNWSIQFWPDKKNTTGRKMQNLVNENKPISVDDIANSSVTVQGLGAIEWLYFEPKSPLSSDSVTTCHLASVISENLDNNATFIAQAWNVNPWVELDEQEWTQEYVSLLSNQLDFSMKKLSRPLAKIGQPRPYFSESWRSHSSLDNLQSNVESFKSIYFANGNGMHAALINQGHADLAARIENQINLLAENWPEESSLFRSLQSKDGYREILSVYNKFEYLKYLVSEELAVNLGVVVGFNSTDGD